MSSLQSDVQNTTSYHLLQSVIFLYINYVQNTTFSFQSYAQNTASYRLLQTVIFVYIHFSLDLLNSSTTPLHAVTPNSSNRLQMEDGHFRSHIGRLQQWL
jgi:hypothetical protein